MKFRRLIGVHMAFLAMFAQIYAPLKVSAGDKETILAGVDRISRQVSDAKILINNLEYRLGQQTANLDKAESRLQALEDAFQEISDNELKQAKDLAKLVERMKESGYRLDIIDDKLVIVGCILSDSVSRLDEASAILAQANAILAELPGQIRRAKLRMFIIGFIAGMGVGMAIGGAAGGATSTVTTSGGGSVNAWTGATTGITTVTTATSAASFGLGFLGLAAIPFAFAGGQQSGCTTAGCIPGRPCTNCASGWGFCKTPECQAAMERLRLYAQEHPELFQQQQPQPEATKPGCTDCEKNSVPNGRLTPVPEGRTPTPMPEPGYVPEAPQPNVTLYVPKQGGVYR